MDRREESVRKINEVRRWLERERLAGVVLESQPNFAWVTAGGNGFVITSQEQAVASVVITADRAVVVTTNIEGRRLTDEELPPQLFDVVEYPWSSPEQQDLLIERIVGSGTVASDSASASRIDASGQLIGLRGALAESEIRRYREVAMEAALAVESVCRGVERRGRERDVAARLAQECYSRDLVPVVNLVAADGRIARYRHPLPTDNRVDRTLMVALTARGFGLHVSLTRFVCFGEPAGDQIVRHRACCRIDAGMICRSRPGTGLAEIFAGAVDDYAAEGFADEWRAHHQGGTTGYQGREEFASSDSAVKLAGSQALAWNPSIAGAKSEDTILVTDRGPEVLTQTGHWPQLEIEVEGATLSRPDLLIR